MPAVPQLARSYGVTFTVATSVVTVFLLGNVVGTLPAGWLVDRFGRRRVMLGGPLVTAASGFAIVHADSFGELLVYRFVGGCAAQMWLIGRLAAISQNAPPDQRGRHVSWMFGMDNTGKMAGPLVGGFLAELGGIRAPFAAYAVLSLLAAVPVLVSQDDAGATPAVAAPAVPSLPWREVFAPRRMFFAVAFFAALTRGPVQADLLHLYAAFTYDLGPAAIGLLATAAAAVSLPLGFVAGWMLDRFGRRRTMVPGFVAVAATALGLAAVAQLHLSVSWYVALFLLGVAAQALTGGSVQTIGTDVAPAAARGMFLGMWRFTGQCGSVSSPVVFALIADAAGFPSSFMFVAASAAIVAYLMLRHVPETRQPADG
ncbi:MAG: hypothetical protein JWN77_1392 [Frankiales bacterium]|nr:hypothetical protein [Frankiales bacterium]